MLADLTGDIENYAHPLSTRHKTGHHRQSIRHTHSIEGLQIAANN